MGGGYAQYLETCFSLEITVLSYPVFCSVLLSFKILASAAAKYNYPTTVHRIKHTTCTTNTEIVIGCVVYWQILLVLLCWSISIKLSWDV